MLMGDIGLDILGIKKLLYLNAAGCTNVRSGPILQLVAVLPATKHLRVLDLSRTGESSPADSDALCKVARRCLDLEYLGLGGCRSVMPESIKTIKARLATSLTTLDLSGCVELDAADDLRHLKKMPVLSTLSFRRRTMRLISSSHCDHLLAGRATREARGSGQARGSGRAVACAGRGVAGTRW